jgi:hypothetical protein
MSIDPSSEGFDGGFACPENVMESDLKVSRH